MDYLRALPRPVDALLVTGDIADHGDEAEYEEAARLLAAPFPVLTCPGHHDARPAYRKALLGQAPGHGPINQVRHVAGTAILMCDSTIPGRDEGLLDAATLAWIDATLAALPHGTPSPTGGWWKAISACRERRKRPERRVPRPCITGTGRQRCSHSADGSDQPIGGH
ncbi:hypothetical protein E5671_05095 [Streptomyces sp. BA2]|nr:hypothetical protein [Streptomyces sp. BA2]